MTRRALCTSILAPASCVRSGRTTRVRIAVLSSSPGTAHIYLAQSPGFFQEQGIDVALQEFPSTGRGMEALLGGSVEVTASVYEQSIQAAAAGREVKSFFLPLSLPGVVLVAAPGKREITRVQDLKQRVVGVGQLGSSGQNYLTLMLLRHGMSLADVRLAAIGNAATAVAALEHNKVDAALVTSATCEMLRARRPDLTLLAEARTKEGTAALFGVPYLPTLTAMARPQWLAANPDTARRLTSALARAGCWIAERSATQIAASLPPSLQTPGSGAALRTLEFAMQAFSRDGRMPPGGPEAVRDYLRLITDPSLNVDLAGTYTNEYLEVAK